VTARAINLNSLMWYACMWTA